MPGVAPGRCLAVQLPPHTGPSRADWWEIYLRLHQPGRERQRKREAEQERLSDRQSETFCFDNLMKTSRSIDCVLYVLVCVFLLCVCLCFFACGVYLNAGVREP